MRGTKRHRVRASLLWKDFASGPLAYQDSVVKSNWMTCHLQDSSALIYTRSGSASLHPPIHLHCVQVVPSGAWLHAHVWSPAALVKVLRSAPADCGLQASQCSSNANEAESKRPFAVVHGLQCLRAPCLLLSLCSLLSQVLLLIAEFLCQLNLTIYLHVCLDDEVYRFLHLEQQWLSAGHRWVGVQVVLSQTGEANQHFPQVFWQFSEKAV